MADYAVTTKDGQKFKLTVPEGQSVQDVYAKFLKSTGGQSAPDQPAADQPAQKQEPQKGYFADLWQSAPRSLVRGITDFISGGLGSMDADTAAALQYGGLNATEIANQGQQQVEKTLEGALDKTGFLPEPQTTPGRILGGGLRAATNPLSYIGPGGPASKAIFGFLGGATSEAAGEATKGTKYEMPARIAGGFAPSLAAPAARAARYPFLGRNVAVSNRDLTRALIEDAGMQGNRFKGRDVASDVAEGMRQRGEHLSEVRPDMVTPADVGGQSTRDLVERISQTPGAQRTGILSFLTDRQRTQIDRMVTDLKRAFGTERTAHAAVEEQLAKQRAEAHPAYTRAYEAGDRDIFSNELERLTAAPEIVEAMKIAASRWRTNAVADGYGAMNPGAMVENRMLKFTGANSPPVFPNIQFWDYTKRALGRMIEDQIKADGRLTDYGKDLNNIRRQLVSALDKEVPEYANARAAHAGPAQYMTAIEMGEDIANGKFNGEVVRHLMDGYSAAEREAARVGYVQGITKKMTTDTAKLPDLTKYLRSPLMREVTSEMMPDFDKAVKWRRQLGFEVGQSELLGTARGGSRTARMQQEFQDASTAVDLLTDVAVAAGGHPQKLATGLIGSMKDKLRNRWRSGSDERTARILSSPAALEHLPLLLGQAPRGPAAPRYGVGALLDDEARQAKGPSLKSLFDAAAAEKRPSMMRSAGPISSSLLELQNDARDHLKDKDKSKQLTTRERVDLRAVSRGTATLEQRMRAKQIFDRPSYGGVQ